VNAEWQHRIDEIVDETSFSGVVHVSRGDEILYERAAGLADRAHEIPITLDTQFGIASGCKGFTALAVMSLVAEEKLSLDTPFRSLVDGEELELIDPAVTVGQLLAHTSGIGDFFPDDADADDYLLPVPVHWLSTTRGYLTVLGGHPMAATPGERFAYCNGGYVLLALVVEAVTGGDFHDVIADRVCRPAGMTRTAYLRTDELPGTAAIGYLPGERSLRTNQLHLPVRGSGDGGAYSTIADFSAFWPALFRGDIVSREVVREMTRAHNDVPEESMRYGLGFWLRADRDTPLLEGYDTGISFRSVYDPASTLLYTVMANTTAGAWPIVGHLDDTLPALVT
jgi:CubicO group peptidase (beta-lactamase class C family)